MTTAAATRPRAGQDRARARLGLVVAVAAIVLGILGMHALTTHGTSHHPGMSGMTAMPELPGTAPMNSTESMSVTGHQHATAPYTAALTPATAATGDSHGGQTGSMIMLCAVMLAAAASAALLLALRHTTTTWRTIPPYVRAVLTRTTARRATGPPPVWEFSVIRC